jgi:probable phosphoglycerate mutase
LSLPDKTTNRPMSSIIFIRHAQSHANAGFRTTDPAAIPLTMQGRQQAERIADLFVEGPTLLITSSFLRTKQTAQALLRRHPTARCEEWDVHEFTYLDAKRCVAMTYDERRPLVEEYWQRGDPTYRDCEDSECFASFMARIGAVLDNVRHRQERSIVVFSHGHVMKAILWLQSNQLSRFGTAEMRSFDEFRRRTIVPNASALRAYIDSEFRLQIDDGVYCSHLPHYLLTA